MTDLERQVVELRIEFELASRKVNVIGNKLYDLEQQLNIDSSELIEEPVSTSHVSPEPVESVRARSPGHPRSTDVRKVRPARVHPPVKRPKWDEAVVGKYIIGGAAALFIFLAAVMGAILVWDSVSDAARLIMIITPGLGLAACGFMFLSKWKNAITALMIGIGAGLVFIGVVSGYMIFGLFNDLTTVFVLTLWSLALTLSFKRTKMFFTSVISYIGIALALILMLDNLKSVQELLITFVFLIVTLGAFLVSTEIWMDKVKRFIAGVMSFVLPFIFLCRLEVGSIKVYGELGIFYAQLMLVVALFGICSYTMRAFSKRKYGVKHIIVEGMLFLSCGGVLATVTGQSNKLFNVLVLAESAVGSTWICYISTLFLFIMIMLYNRRNFLVPLVYVIYTLAVASIVFDVEGIRLFSFTFGWGLVAVAIVWLKDLRFNKNYAVTLIVLALAFINIVSQFEYWMFSDSSTTVGNILMVLEVISVIVTGCVLVRYLYIKNEKLGFEFYKIFLFITVTTALTFLVCSFISPEWGVWGVERHNWRSITVAGMLTLLSVGAIYFGYFINWANGNLALLREGVTKRYELDGSGIIFSFMLSLLYFYDLIIYSMTDKWYTSLIALIFVLIVAATQSYLFFNRLRWSSFAMVWLGIKYLIITWSVMYVSFGVGINTILTSIVGIGVAATSIYIGFKFRVKVLRLFGLVLTLLMTAKALIVDLNMDNPVTLLVSLVLGGAVCFVISVVYTRLERSLKSDISGDTLEVEEPNIDLGIDEV